MRTLALALALLTACSTAAPPPATPAPGSDEFEIQATVLAVYNVISGPAGRRDWDRFQGLFAPGARLIHGTRVMTPDEYSKGAQTYFADHGFFERPASTRIEHFKDIAHVWSAYESRHNAADDKPFARGVNSFQLVRNNGHWQVLTIFWQEE